MIIKNGNVITANEIKKCDIKIANGKIAELGFFESCDGDVLDASGCYISPGFVDIHTHGGGGGDFMDATAESFDKALDFHTKNGTTSILATSVTAPVNQILDMLSVSRGYIGRRNNICKIQGVHLEGPYISYNTRGAQHEKYLRIPSRDNYSFITKNSDIVRTVTIAPELEGATEMVTELKKNGIIVCGGHDDGEKRTIMPTIEAGLSHCTHLWCAMSTVAMRNMKRSVGLCELGLLDDRLSVEIIADNHHIVPDMTKLIYKCKTSDKMCLVSDCLRAGGMPVDDTLYTLGNKYDELSQKFVVSEGVAMMSDRTHYAGSIQPLSQMVKNLIYTCDIPIVDAIKMASLTPAKIVGLDSEVGSIEIGKSADICILDNKFNVINTIINGKEA